MRFPGAAVHSPVSDGTMVHTQKPSTEGSGCPALVGTFHVPSLSLYPDSFQNFADRDFIEHSTMVTLENAGRLNWWTRVGADCQRLLPLVTRGDGNCLLHAASMSIWGIHDKDLTLRKSLHAQMDHGLKREALRRRWRWQQTQQNRELGLQFTVEEWEKEWNELLKLASSEPKTQQSESCSSLVSKVKSPEMPIYESLEEFHVFVLAHMLQRPIIVVADTMLKDSEGDAFAPIPFGGIYLPLEVPALECQSSPLVLAYDNGHFSALVSAEQKDSTQGQAVIPLTDSEHNMLPIHFAVDPGEQWKSDTEDPESKHCFSLPLSSVTLSLEAKLQLLHSYLNVIWLPLSHQEQQVSLAATEFTSPSAGLEDQEKDAKPSSGHLDVGAGDGEGESGAASGDKGTNVVCHPQGFSVAGPDYKKEKLGSFRNSLSSKILKNVSGLMTIKRSQKGDKGNSKEPEVSGNLSSPSCGEQHNSVTRICGDRYDVKLSVDILQAAMQGDRNYIFAALLSTFSCQPGLEGTGQQCVADAKESLEGELDQQQDMRKKEELAPSSEMQVKKKKVTIDFYSTTLKDNSDDLSSSPLDSGESNTTFHSIYHSIFPFAQPTVMFFTHASVIITRKLLADSLPSLFSWRIPPPAKHVAPAQDAPNVQRCAAEKDVDCLSERVQEGDVRGSLSNGCLVNSWEIQSSPPLVSPSSLDSRADSRPTKCRTASCSFYGRPETSNYCSCCYREELKRSKVEQGLHSS
ncbi:OTU domain-containing protein 7B-like isoform X1 [Arapaima gigas]